MFNGSPLREMKDESLPNAVVQEYDAAWTDLHEAAANGDDNKLQILLSAGLDRTAKESKHGNTALHEAAWRGYSRCVKLLCTPLHHRKDLKDEKLKRVLHVTRNAMHSALLSIRNMGGFSALHLAAQNGHNQSCREILLSGGDPDVQNNFGDTALHTACRYGHAGATRILLSASCNPNKTNLNGDSPLHITCAMSRRKLTRILLEADCQIETKNAQGETPRDIALRKNYEEILKILDSPHRLGNRKSSRSMEKKKKGGDTEAPKASRHLNNIDCINGISWSPYGCHYFPDPRSFPSPKLQTLPKEPLKKGEQYYLDLAGNICKGPVGVGNTCFCEPFLKHIGDKINRNRKSLRMYVVKETERLDSKMQALAIRTDGQIEQLTRSMMADRIRCESRRLHLEHWLMRDEPFRLRTMRKSRSKQVDQDRGSTLTRSRSLEFIDDEDVFGRDVLPNSKSFDTLDESDRHLRVGDLELEQHQFHGGNGRVSALSAVSLEQLASFGMDGDKKCYEDEVDFNVSERLEELLTKTNRILEMEKESSEKRKNVFLTFMSPRTKSGSDGNVDHFSGIVDHFNGVPEEQRASLVLDKNLNDVVHCETPPNSYAQHSRSGYLDENEVGIASSSQLYHSNLLRDREKRSSIDYQLECFRSKPEDTILAHNLARRNPDEILHAPIDGNRNETDLMRPEMLQKPDKIKEENLNLSKAAFLQSGSSKEYPRLRSRSDEATANKILQTEKVAITPMRDISELCINSGGSGDPQLQDSKSHQKVFGSKMSEGFFGRRKMLSKNTNEPEVEMPEESVSGTIKKVEIKNSEIKSLKKPSTTGVLKKSRVHKLVARLQGKSSSSSKNAPKPPPDDVPKEPNKSDSESSEDEKNDSYNYNVYNSSNAAPEKKPSPERRSIPTNAAHRYPINHPQIVGLLDNRIANGSSTGFYLERQQAEMHFNEVQNGMNVLYQERPTGNGANNTPNKNDFNENENLYQKNSPLPPEPTASSPLRRSLCSIPSNSPSCNTTPQSLHQPIQYLHPNLLCTKLLSNRKFLESTQRYSLSPNVSPNQEFVDQNDLMPNSHPHSSCVPSLHFRHEAAEVNQILPDQHVEHGANNDSGISSHMYYRKESFRPSPSLSGQSDYTSIELQSPTHIQYANNNARVPADSLNNNIVYHIGNASSLV